MKCLLTAVNAKYIHSNPAVYSLRAFAAEFGPHISIAEYTINQRMEDILSNIYEQSPDVIAFSCYIWNWKLVGELIRELPKLLPGVPIWLGGPEVSYDAKRILEENPGVTGIMTGEGEAVFRNLMRYYVKKDIRLEEIPGIQYGGGKTLPAALLSMSELPFPYEDISVFENRIIYYESQRGCPFRCSYCLSSIDKSVRYRDMHLVHRELQFFLDHRVSQVKFVDRTFNCSHAHAMGVWNYIRENDNGITNFHFEISADLLNEAEIALLASMRSGLVQLEIGVQSVNPETLQAINRSMDLEKLKRNCERISESHNIHQHLDLIAGLPYEDYKSFALSFDEVYSLHPQQLQLGFLKVLKGSPMEEMAGEYGINYTSVPPYEVLYSKWLSYHELRRLKAVEEVVEVYYNSGQFRQTLLLLEQAFPTAFALYEALAAYHEETGHPTGSPSRISRYENLLDFACRYDRSHTEVYKELLVYDLYLRENVKSRPIFAADVSEWKDRQRSFYRREAEERQYLPEYRGCDAGQLSRMTHLEGFFYPVWRQEPEEIRNKAGEMCFVLFDYRKKEGWSADAAVLFPEVPMERAAAQKSGG